MFDFEKSVWTVAMLEANRGLIDCNPVHQRLEREEEKDGITKSQSIIDEGN